MSGQEDLRNLIVAAGGTGTRIAQQFVDQWQQVGGVPNNVEIVVVDAHREPEVDIATDYEMVTIDSPVFYSKAHERMLEKEPELLESWWPEDVEPDDTVDFIQGCGADRANGRFFVSYFGDRIVSAIRRGIEKLFSTGAHQGPAARLNTYILASLGNGTGGGTFLPLSIIAASLAHDRGQAPRVYGVFVPGTTTSAGSQHLSMPNAAPRIGANGVGSLVELQYEMNRGTYSARRDRFQYAPSEPASVYTSGRRFELPGDETYPFSFVFLIDRKNQTGQLRDYPEVVSIAARSLFSLVDGADDDNRLLDMKHHASGPFASMGYTRMRSPVSEALDYAVLELLQDAGRRLKRSSPEEKHRELALSFGDEVCDEPTVPGSVDFFMDRMARIRETDTSDPFFERLRNSFESSPPEFDLKPSTPADFKNAENTIGSWLTDHKRRAAEAAEAILEGERDGLSEDEDLHGEALQAAMRECGVRWLLERVVGELARAGAFHLLAEWLNELKVRIEESRNSVKRTEFAQVEGFDYELPADLEDLIERHRRESESWVSIFTTTEQEQLAGAARSRLESYYRNGRMFAEVDAALEFYDELERIVDRHFRVASRLRESLSKTLDPRKYEREQNELAEFLAESTLQSSDELAETVELVVGTREDVDGVVDELREDRRPTGAGLVAATSDLETIHERMFSIVADEQDLHLAHLDLAEQEEIDASDFRRRQWPQDYSRLLERAIRTACRKRVSEEMSLQRLLERRAESVVDEFLEVGLPALNDGTVGVTPGARDAVDAMRELVGDRYDDLVRRFEAARDDEEARREAVVTGVETRLEMLVDLGVANWYPEPHRRDERISTRQLLLYRDPAEGSSLDRATDALEDPASGLHTKERRHYDPNQIDCVTVEIGARLEDLRTSLVEPDLVNYRQTLTTNRGVGRNFSPHIEREYEDAGRRFLNWLEARHEGERPGAVVLALAEFQVDDQPELFNYLTGDADGHYRWRRDLKVDGRVVVERDTKIEPTGIAEVVEWLDGQRRYGSGAFAEVGRDLRTRVRRDLMAWIDGDPERREIEPVGPERVVEELSSYRARIEAELADLTEGFRRRAVETQVRQLGLVVDEIGESGGDVVPAILQE